MYKRQVVAEALVRAAVMVRTALRSGLVHIVRVAVMAQALVRLQNRALMQIRLQVSKLRLQALQMLVHLVAVVAVAQVLQAHLVVRVESPLRLARIVLQSAENMKSLKHQ